MARRRQDVEIRGKDNSKAAFASLQNSAMRTKTVFGSLAGKLKSAFLPLAGAAGAISLIRNTSRAMNELDLIAKRARTTGLGTDMFQSMGLAAEEANVSQSLLNSSLVAFVKRVGEAKAGVGPLVSGLKNADAALLQNIRSARNQEEALKVLADGVRNAETATDKARIANAAFGRSGIELVRILNLGAQGLDATAEKAQRLGLIYDRDLLKRQEQLNNDLGVFNKVIGVQFKSILVELAPILTALAKTTAGWARSLRGLFDSIMNTGVAATTKLKMELAQMNKVLAEGEFVGEAQRNAHIRQIELKTQELKAVTDAMRQVQQSVNTQAKGDFRGGGGGTITVPSVPLSPSISATTAKVTAATKPLKLFRSEVKKTADEAGIMSEAFSTGMSTVQNAISQMVESGKVDFKGLVTSFLSDMARLATSNLFRNLGGALGGGGGFLGSLFGGGAQVGGLRFGGLFANGGRIRSNEFGIVGERGPELVQGPAAVTPMGGTTGGNTFNISLSAPNANSETVQMLRAELETLKRDLPRLVAGANSQQRRYAPGRF